MQAPGDTIKWFHRFFMSQLKRLRAYGEMPGYHPMLVEQQMTLLMKAAGVTTTTVDTLTTTIDLLDHPKVMATMREKVVKRSCKEYLLCKFLLLANRERHKPLRTHLENGHIEQKKPYPTIVEDMKTLMADYTVPGGAAPTAARKSVDDQGVVFAETQEWIKRATCFGCREKGHLLATCK